MFVCHGNICRSPMAEYMFIDMIKKKGIISHFLVSSSATSYEEIGNGVHYGTRRILNNLGIDCNGKKAIKLEKSDYDKYDYFIGMDDYNVLNMQRLFNTDKKIYKLLEFNNTNRDVKDPWYTGNFDETFEDIKDGLNAFLNYLLKKHNI